MVCRTSRPSSAASTAATHRRFVGDPGEVQRRAVAAVRGGKPLVVGRDRAHLGHVQHRCDALAHRVESAQRGYHGGARHEVLRLQLVPVARREVQPEVREPRVPRPVEPSRGVQDGSTPRTMCRGPSAGFMPSHPAGPLLHPNLLEPLAREVGEQAHAVRPRRAPPARRRSTADPPGWSAARPLVRRDHSRACWRVLAVLFAGESNSGAKRRLTGLPQMMGTRS